MGIAEYIALGIGVLILICIYGFIYIMTSEKKKNTKNWIANWIESWSKDKCVRCGNPTAYNKKVSSLKRVGYMEGAGQLCKNCNDYIYPRSAAER